MGSQSLASDGTASMTAAASATASATSVAPSSVTGRSVAFDTEGAASIDTASAANVKVPRMKVKKVSIVQQVEALEIDDFSDYEDQEHNRRSSLVDGLETDWSNLPGLAAANAASPTVLQSQAEPSRQTSGGYTWDVQPPVAADSDASDSDLQEDPNEFY